MIFSIFGKKEKAGSRRKESETAGQRGGPATGPHPSTASTTSVDQREIARRTAEKIDLIESQMDLALPARVSKPHAGSRSDSLPPAAPQRPLPAGIDEGGMVRFPGAGAPREAAARLSPGGANDPSTSMILGEPGVNNAMEVLTSGLLPVFEEASVLYSNGQANDAAMILWQAIRENQLGQHTQQAWKMLFELYQAGGRRQDFESLAIDYASRFESSPPAWSDDLSPPAAAEPRSVAGSTILFPPRLDAQAIKQVEQIQRAAQRSRPTAVDFSKVATVDHVGADLLLRVLMDFRRNGGDLTLIGVEQLRAALSDSIANGRRDESDACWLLKLETLRFLGEQQRFEDLAIDYCVTYEVSPPSWEPMPASMRLHNASAAAPAELPLPALPTADAFPLEGELDGRPDATFKSLRAYSQSHPEIVIDCRRLRRMDFVCAGEMLNEVAALRSAGKFLVFKDLSYLVACLLMVMGIHDLAELNLRTA